MGYSIQPLRYARERLPKENDDSNNEKEGYTVSKMILQSRSILYQQCSNLHLSLYAQPRPNALLFSLYKKAVLSPSPPRRRCSDAHIWCLKTHELCC
ncbi:hypothetical protein AAHA92_04565 [Salvia divinorum]|uniref:Uncharacterized protein n=1 Tax=Salvia divinorum TaxID=28513 RepID=A0ABD1I1M8_SALDI